MARTRRRPGGGTTADRTTDAASPDASDEAAALRTEATREPDISDADADQGGTSQVEAVPAAEENAAPTAPDEPVEGTSEVEALPEEPSSGAPGHVTPDASPDASVQPVWEAVPTPEDDPAETPAAPDSYAQTPRNYADESEPAAPARHASDSIIPMLIGGVLAALVGFFAARYLDNRDVASGPAPSELAQSIDAQSQRIDALQASVDELAAADPQSGIDAATRPLQAALSDAGSRIDDLAARLNKLSDRVETIAMRPEAPGLDPGEFDQALTDFRSELKSAIDAAQAEIAQAREEAQTITDRAFASEQAAAARAAWQQVSAAIIAGDPYDGPLQEARATLDVEIPQPLVDAASEGIATLAELQESFPARARAALDTSIRTSAGGGFLDRAGAFLRVQSGVRSLSPREGDDPDAILSRAEADVRRGDLRGALDEIEALPPEGQNAMRPWTADAETRLAVLAAADAVAQKLETE